MRIGVLPAGTTMTTSRVSSSATPLPRTTISARKTCAKLRGSWKSFRNRTLKVTVLPGVTP